MNVGDKVFVVRSDNARTKREAVVSKVGRDWIYIDDGRRRFPRGQPFPTNLRSSSNNDISYGQVWASEADYVETVSTSLAFQRLKSRMSYHPKAGVTLADIKEAARLLRIDIAE